MLMNITYTKCPKTKETTELHETNTKHEAKNTKKSKFWCLQLVYTEKVWKLTAGFPDVEILVALASDDGINDAGRSVIVPFLRRTYTLVKSQVRHRSFCGQGNIPVGLTRARSTRRCCETGCLGDSYLRIRKLLKIF